MVEESAAMKIINQNLSTLGGKQKAIKDNKITHALLLRRTKTKDALLKNRGTMKLNINSRHTFNGGAKILKNKTQIAPLTEVSMKH